jgi:hypothetical protein
MRLFFSIIILSSPLKMDVTICLIPSSREEGHYDDISPESAVAESEGPPVPEENLKSEEEKKARRK